MRSIMFMSPGEVVLSTGEDLQRNEKTIIRNEISSVSPGTELALLSGNESWAPLPYIPGYGSVGKIEKAGSECGEEGLREGDRVFTYGKHAGATYADTVCVAVPEGLPPEKAAFLPSRGTSGERFRQESLRSTSSRSNISMMSPGRISS